MPQNPQTEAGSFYAAFEACPAWQPFQCKQSDAGMSCYLSTLSMFKRLVSNELLRLRTLGHFRAVSQSPPAVAALHAVMAGRPRTLRARGQSSAFELCFRRSDQHVTGSGP